MQDTWVSSLDWEDPLEKVMATHSSILAWRILWTEEPGRLQSMALAGDIFPYFCSLIHSASICWSLTISQYNMGLPSAWKAAAMSKTQSPLSRSLHFRREDVLISLGYHNKLAQNGWVAPTKIYVLSGLETRNEGISRVMLLLKALGENSWLWLSNLSLCLLHTAFPVCLLLPYLLWGHF